MSRYSPVVEMPAPKLQSPALVPHTTGRADVVDAACERSARWIALRVIADTAFPQAKLLPRVAPLPKAQAGHQMLMDYELMAGIVWGAVKRLQQEFRAIRFRRFALGCIALLLLALALTWAALSSVEALTSAAMVVTAIVIPIILIGSRAHVAITTARVKYELMDDIKNGRVQNLVDQSDVGRGGPLVGWTNGVVSTDETLICFSEVSHDEAGGSGELFSGLGHPIATQFYGCQPSAGNDGVRRFSGTDDAIAAVRDVLRQLWPELQDSQTPVRMGDVVLVDPTSMVDPRFRSPSQEQPPWIDDEGRPRLRVKMPLSAPDARIRALGGRKFLAVQLLFGEGATVATLLLRPTVVSGAAVLETVTLTMGPPNRGHEWIEQHMLDLREYDIWTHLSRGALGLSRGRFSLLWRMLIRFPARRKRIGQSSPLLDRWRETVEASPNLRELIRFDAYHPWSQRQENAWAERLAELEPRWLGHNAELPNFRAMLSEIFSSGAGAACHRNALILVLDRIVREILSCFEDRGYDVSKYRTESGHWQINAESIENLSITQNQGGDEKPRRSERRSERRSDDNVGTRESARR
jgi:hypothetical protein